MGKLRSFLRFFVCFGVAFFANAAFAGGYTCPTYRQYTSCAQNYYMSGGAQVGNSCLACPSGTGWQSTTTANNTSAGCACPTNYWNSTTHGSTVVSGQTCSIKSVTCAAGTYLKEGETSCTQCPAGSYCPGNTYTVSTVDQGRSICPTGYPNSDAGSSVITNCYSNQKLRAWGGLQVKCTTPDGCSTATCKKCVNDPCPYVAYSNTNGTADGVIKSGCATNNASCKQSVGLVTASANYYVNGTACYSCPSDYPKSDDGNTGGQTACYATCTRQCTKPQCPSNATCTWATTSTSGIQYVGGTCNAAESTCGFTFTCEYGYQKTADGTQCEPITTTITYKPGAGATSNTAESNRHQNVTYGQLFTPRNVSKSDLDFVKPGFKFNRWSGSYPDPSRAYTYINDTPIEVDALWNACDADVQSYGQCGCASDQYPNGDGCSDCVISCGDVSSIYKLGSYNMCTGEDDSKCYRNCTTDDVTNSVTVTGTEYNGGDYTCESTQCKTGYYIYEGMCEKCPTNAYCDGSKDYVCNNGYTLDNGQCVANKYTVTFDPNGGTLASATTLTVTYNSKLSTLSSAYIPTHTDPTQHFSGYYDAKTGGTQYYDKSGNPTKAMWDKASNATLYARWGQTLVYCENVGAGKYYDGGAAQICPEGYYCPGEGDAYEGAEGCKIECSTLGSEYSYSDAGATSPSDCYKPCETLCSGENTDACAFPMVTKDCTYNSDASVAGKQYYNTSTCAVTNSADALCPLSSFTCATRYYHTGVGCDLCTSLADGSFTLSVNRNAGGAGACYKPCTRACDQQSCPNNASCTHGSTVKNGGYYYYNPDVCTAPYSSCEITINCFDNYTLNSETAQCDPNTYTVTLNDGDGTGGNGAIYEKYATGWFSDSGTTNAIAKATVPTRDGWTFLGYYIEQSGGSKIISESGALPASTTFTANATLYARWSQNAFNCQAGKYYNGSEFVTCPAGMYCDGSGTVPVNDQGCGVQCPSGGASSGGATAATECFVACPTPATIKNGTLSNTQARQNWNGTEYPACTFTATCDSGYVAKDSPGTNPTCTWSGADLCPTGFYCPEGEDPQACPDGGTSYSADKENQARSITDCYKIFDPYDGFKNGSASAKCYYQTATTKYDRCQINEVKTCYDGYWYPNPTMPDEFLCRSVRDKHYSPNPNIYQTECPDKANQYVHSEENAVSYVNCYKQCVLDVPHAATVAAAKNIVYGISTTQYEACSFNVTCDTGYTVHNNNTATPSCQANAYTITLDKNGGTGSTPASVTCTFDSGACTMPATSGLNRAGYSVEAKWCSTKNGGAPCYAADKSIAENISGDGTAITLYAVWAPQVYTVKLDSRNADVVAVPDMVYLKYATGWFKNAAATDPIIALTTLPSKEAWFFTGFYDAVDGGQQIVNADGKFGTSEAALKMTTTSPATIYARMEAGTVTCDAGTYYTGTGPNCTICPANNYCEGGTFGADSGTVGGLVACPDSGKSPTSATSAALGDGSWKYSDSGATSSSQCYRKCEPYAIVGGTAIPVNKTEYWPKDCEYKGRSDNGNECEIVDGVCVETACRGDYEMIDNHCEPCNRDHALEYDMNNGNCNVKSCEIGYHPYGQSCEQDVRECSAPNAISAQQHWDKTKKAFGACTVMECESGFHIAANACVSDVQPCTVDNGTGTKEWNHDTNAWNACVATSCNPGYTNDPSETNDANVECGRCANMFGVGGERAASSYVRGCEIASCMYQGEIYNLEDNECKPICTEDSDDTGSRRRVGNKCVSTCNAGYTAW